MKQAEHPPVTAGANSAAEYSLAIIDQLARIGRTCSKEEMDELVYRLLAFVGGHLRSARENLRMLTLLEEKQKSLEQNLQAVKLEQQMLKVLCKDSTSVYRVDLMNDRAEIVKIEEHSNSAGDLLPHGQELFSYAEAVEHYYHKCVLKESAPDFLQFLDAENLMRELRTKDRVSRRYQSVPNAIGNIYFEARANRVQQTETSFQILLDFRSVDEIVREEREHQHALETALTESRMSYEVISAISKIYYTIYRIDLRTGYYEEVASERQMHRLTGHSGRASVHMSEMSKQSIVAGVSALCRAVFRPFDARGETVARGLRDARIPREGRQLASCALHRADAREKWRGGAGAVRDAPLQRRKAPRKGSDERGRCGTPRE